MAYTSKKIGNNVINNRYSNFELLRILAMLLIILSHLSGHGIRTNVQLLNDTLFHQINNLILILSGFSGKIGVNIFLLISGYFLINKNFNFKNFFKIFIMTLFYSYTFLLMSIIVGSHDVKPILIIRSLFPIGGSAYWFITTYLVLYIFINYINSFLKHLSQDSYKKFILICFTLWSLIPTLTIKANYGFSNLTWFIFVYSVGAYFKIYNIKFKFVNCLYLLFSIITIQLTIIYIFLLYVSINIPSYFFNINNIYQFIMAVAIFNIFGNLELNHNILINKIASSVFAVYLIHDNMFLRPYLWHNILHIENILYLNNYLLITVITVVSIFCLCILADKICIQIYTPIINLLVNFTQKYTK